MEVNQQPEYKHHTVTREEIARFNTIREQVRGKNLTRSELNSILKKLGYRTLDVLIMCMIKGKNPPIIRVSRGHYTFNLNPVHILRLQEVFNDVAKYNNGETRKTTIEYTVENAIFFLKDKGYKIYKPITQYKEL